MSAFPSILMTANGNSVPLIIDMTAVPYFGSTPGYALGLICTVSPGASLIYAVQVTGDQKPVANGNWNNHDVVVAQTGSVNSNIAYPITGLRLNVTSYVSGSVNLGVVRWP